MAKAKQQQPVTAPETSPTAMAQALASAQVLAKPVTAASVAMPQVVPSATPEPQPAIVNKFTADAYNAAIALKALDSKRYGIWQGLADKCESPADLKTMAQALETECDRIGMARAKVEASEWKAFAVLYHYDKSAALRIIAPDFKQPVINKDGTQKKDPLGQPIMRHPGSAGVVNALRSERDLLCKKGTIPEEVHKVRAPGTNNKDNGPKERKLSGTEFDRLCDNIKGCSTDQLAGAFVRIVDAFKTHGLSAEGQEAYIQSMRTVLTEWTQSIKPDSTVPQGPTLKKA